MLPWLFVAASVRRAGKAAKFRQRVEFAGKYFRQRIPKFTAMRLFAGTEFDIPPRCERCNELESDCDCPALPDPGPDRISPARQMARIQKEKRKKGKSVTVIRGLHELDLPELLVRLKNACGAGGTIKEGTLEIQGDHVTRVAGVLKELGYRSKPRQ